MTNQPGNTTTESTAAARKEGEGAKKKGRSVGKFRGKGSQRARTARVRKGLKPRTATGRAKSSAETRPGTTKAKVLGMLARKGGASMTEIREVTNWQPHTIRAFVSLLGTKMKFAIMSTRQADGVRVYAISSEPS